MALKIRLRRMGRKNAPTYRIVVAESSMPRDGRFVASIGHYNPRTEPMTLVVDREQALQWLGRGAMPTDTARSLLKRAGVFGPEPETRVEAAVTAVKKTAGKVAKKVASAAKELAEDVKEIAEDVKEAADDVRERVTGEDKADEAEAASEPTAEADTAEAEDDASEAEAKA